MKDEQFTRLESELSSMFHRAKAHMKEAAESFDPPLPTATYTLLSYMVKNGPARAHELAEAFGADAATVSRHLRAMVDQGLLQRTPDPEDGRSYILKVSEKAAEQWNASFEKSQEIVRSLVKTWSEKDGERFTEFLSRLTHA